MRQLEDHFLATAAADPAAWVEDSVLMAVAHACWEGGLRGDARPGGREAQASLAVQPGALLRALGQVPCMFAD